MSGTKYKGDLMVIGRALNGWDNVWCPMEATDSSGIDRVVKRVRESVGDLSWVSECWGSSTDYNTKRSPFWRTTRGVVVGLNLCDPESSDWHAHIIWSNLYKVAPKEGGNPGSKLCALQEPYCKDLISTEIEVYKPKRVLFVTGYDWAKPFLDAEKWHIDSETIIGNAHVQAIVSYKIGGSKKGKAVIAARPEGRVEEKWIRSVVAAFSE